MEEVNSGGRERRLSPRFEAALDCRLALPDSERSSGLLFPDAFLRARTRDLSETGLGVVAASIYVGYDCVVDAGRTLLVTLEAPRGPIEMTATNVHYTRLGAGAEDAAYLLGLRVVGMTDGNRALYAELLRELERDSNTAEGSR
ncbi:MAG TPA: PilZ domain-containing protein [Pyrinomonadaceae bacterium]|nr:PilZ domain-containing protein [Pyrinomonadaceae bacterium]